MVKVEKLQTGDTKTICLEKEGVGGYTWQLHSNNAPKIVSVSAAVPAASAESKIPGASAGAWFSITALSNGRATLTFSLQRQWEIPSLPIKIETLLVQVDEMKI